MNVRPENAFQKLLELCRRLDDAKISFNLSRIRDEAVMIEIAVPGQRWEVEFVDYGDEVHVEIERFISSGDMDDEGLLETLFANFSDTEDVPNESLAES